MKSTKEHGEIVRMITSTRKERQADSWPGKDWLSWPKAKFSSGSFGVIYVSIYI